MKQTFYTQYTYSLNLRAFQIIKQKNIMRTFPNVHIQQPKNIIAIMGRGERKQDQNK
jgi:hypothetical protein